MKKKKRRNVPDDSDCVVLRNKNLGPLQDLLLKACPPDPGTKEKSLGILSDLLECSRYTPYLWIKEDRIPARRVVEIVQLSKGRVEKEEFDQFVYA